MKKTISICLALFLAIFMTVPAFAAGTGSYTAESVMSPKFTYIWSMSAGLDISSSGKARCSGSVDASSNSYTAELTVSLQKYTSSGWTTIKSWNGSGSGQGLIVENYYYVSNGTYRVCSMAKIYNSAGKLLETQSFYSAEETY
ncbi:MAG: hypothetical protein GX488_10540 [Clostridiales bacterium]|nr:hypothetical protein [Clostridiales bacterium]